MSVWSSWNYRCTFPKGTEMHEESYDYEHVVEIGDHLEVTYEDGEGGYAHHMLDDLIELFGKPLDEVPGLELHAWYRYEENEYEEVTVDIKDGKVRCEQTVKTWEPCTLAQTGIEIGRKE